MSNRGPLLIYLDNAKTFQAVVKWLKQMEETEKLHEFLTTENITWRFNLPRVSWWGSQFERPIGITKQPLSILKMISNILFQDLTV